EADSLVLPPDAASDAVAAPGGSTGANGAQTSGAPHQAGADGTDWARRPDLMLIDGGKGQLHAALAVLEELGITDQPIASLAKQEEELFVPGRAESIRLPVNSQALFLVQRVRDEAHRFAITFHRDTRGKRSLQSQLDTVPGVGSRRKRDLLRQFGSLAALRKASVEEIAAVPGIGQKTALAIREHLGDA
ncbi:MAG TPA: helix-hairpin-helix domain-containing protein, partial [Chloroflexota bacterium]|nr:helix-hairpin-helix domain-containing protein [Chloroflexota bacterium]